MEDKDLVIFSDIANTYNVSYVKTLVEQLSEYIFQGILEPGYAFPNENKMCKILNVSRSTLREAYKVLETYGYIDRSNAGTIVKDIHRLAEGGSFNTSIRLSNEDNIIEFILILEPEATALAAQRMTPRELAYLKDKARACEQNQDNLEKLEKYNHELHSLIRKSCKNNLLVSSINASYKAFNQMVIQRVYTESRAPEFVKKSINQHSALIDALEHKDGDKARKIMQMHLLEDIKFTQLHS